MNAAESQADAMVLPGNGVPGVNMTAVVSPAAGWVRVSSTVRGIRAGERCQIGVSTRDGRREVAHPGSPPRAACARARVDGAAIVAPGHRRRGGVQRRRRRVRLPPRVTSTAGHPIGRLWPGGLAGRKRAQPRTDSRLAAGASAASVRAMKRRDTADIDVLVAALLPAERDI